MKLLKENNIEACNGFKSLFSHNLLDGDAKIITEKEIILLKEWIVVYNSFKQSVWSIVCDSVRQSFNDLMWRSVKNSIKNNIKFPIFKSSSFVALSSIYPQSSVYAYVSSFFPEIRKWKGIEHEEGKNPFQSCIDLCKSGFVPAYDRFGWMLLSGKDAKIIYATNTLSMHYHQKNKKSL